MYISPRATESHFPLTWTLPEVPNNSVDWVLNGFDEQNIDNLRLVPIDQGESWETLEMLYSQDHKTMMLGIFPLFTQIGSRFDRAMRSLRTPTCILPQEKYAVGVAVLMDTLEINTVVLTQAVLEQFENLMRETYPMRIMQYQVVLSPNERIEKTAHPLHVTYEVHLVPGMVGLFQCEKLVRDQQYEFHPSDRFVWEVDNSYIRVTDPSLSPRFSRAQLPQEVRVRYDICECGRDMHISYV